MEMKKLQTSRTELQVKSLEDGSVYLEGWANKAIADRGRDLISKKEWDIENYKKNAIMLFNHDHSKPIGKMIEVEPREEGLYVKGRISNSRDPEISRIRDLVKEGILNSMSVGIWVGDVEQKGDVNHLKSVELHECSVVAVPMNQESQFAVTTKSMGQGTMLDTLELITHEVGAKDVEKACHKLHAHETATAFESVDQVADQLALECEIDKDKAKDFLTLHTAETPIEIKTWLDEQTEETEEEEQAEKAKLDGKDVQVVMVSKDAVENLDELIAWAEESGWSTDNIEEDDDDYLLVQNDQEAFTDDLTEVDLGDGVRAMVGTLKGAEIEENLVPEDEVTDDQKSLLDDEDPTGATPTEIQADKADTVDHAEQTNVLLNNMITLLQQLNEKIDGIAKSSETKQKPDIDKAPTFEMSTEDDEEEITKKIHQFMSKTNERLSTLGL